MLSKLLECRAEFIRTKRHLLSQVTAQLGGEVRPSLQIDRSVDAVLGGAPVDLAIRAALAIFEGQLAAATLGGVDRGVDLDIAVGIER